MTTLLDGWICAVEPRADPLQVVEVIDVPMTLAGLSKVNVENVLAVTSATLALGFSVQQVAAGLRSFDPNDTTRADEHLDGPDHQRNDQCRDRLGPQRGWARGAVGDHEWDSHAARPVAAWCRYRG
jgi:hypothetical protein